MQYILLSGGSGRRLWPLSNEVRSKQFLKIIKKEDGVHESMLQHMYRMIREVDNDAMVTIATSQDQISTIYDQLGDEVCISVEPNRRDTFPAISLATAFLHDVKKVSLNEVVVVCPIDPYVENTFFQMLLNLHEQAKKGETNLCLIGIEPTYPSEKYGYILPKSKDDISFVDSFKEKPDVATAEEYIRRGALWNAGVFAYKLKYVLDIARDLFGTASYQELFDNYDNLEKISFDYAVVEKEQMIQVMRFSGKWMDLGTWNALTEVMSDEVSGNAVAADCENIHMINELQIPMIALGVNSVAIVATPDGILVTDKRASDKLKDYVSVQRPMYEKKEWGEYQIIDYRINPDESNYLTKHLVISSGQYISYQKHMRRTETWIIIDGTGKIIIDGQISVVNRGDTVYIKPGMKHGIKADTELHIIEVQVGDELTEEDIEKIDWDWNQEGLY